MLAVMTAVPAPTARTVPFSDTTAASGLLLVHVMTAPSGTVEAWRAVSSPTVRRSSETGSVTPFSVGAVPLTVTVELTVAPVAVWVA